MATSERLAEGADVIRDVNTAVLFGTRVLTILSGFLRDLAEATAEYEGR